MPKQLKGNKMSKGQMGRKKKTSHFRHFIFNSAYFD